MFDSYTDVEHFENHEEDIKLEEKVLDNAYNYYNQDGKN